MALVVIAQNVRGQYFSSLGTAGIGPDTIDERARPLLHTNNKTLSLRHHEILQYISNLLELKHDFSIYTFHVIST